MDVRAVTLDGRSRCAHIANAPARIVETMTALTIPIFRLRARGCVALSKLDCEDADGVGVGPAPRRAGVPDSLFFFATIDFRWFGRSGCGSGQRKWQAAANFSKQPSIETKAAIEIREPAVGFAGEASAPKTRFSRITHVCYPRRSRIVQQPKRFRQTNFRLDETA